MNFGFTEEQELLRQQVRKFLDGQCPMEEVRRIAEMTDGYSREQWKQLAELGWLGLVIPEQYGGSDLGWEELVVLLEETGRTLFPAPLISTTLAASAILDTGSEAQKERWLPRIADGSCIGTLAIIEESDILGPTGIQLRGEPDGDGFVLRGEKRYVPDAAQANLAVVAFRTGDAEQDLSLALVETDATGATAEECRTIDRTKRLATLKLDDVRVGPEAILGRPGSAAAAIAELLDRGAIAVTAEMIGASEGAHALTVQYAKDRVQFGSPIGRFQGVKHPLAEGYVDIESMKSLLYYAAWALDASPEEVAFSASKAKGLASEAFTRIGVTAIQLHGAVGYTEEYDIQLYLKRSKWARPMYGGEDYHYDRVATLGGI
jgi:alkylation response protein AidB-like acyl-CoA dehydrogenase